MREMFAQSDCRRMAEPDLRSWIFRMCVWRISWKHRWLWTLVELQALNLMLYGELTPSRRFTRSCVAQFISGEVPSQNKVILVRGIVLAQSSYCRAFRRGVWPPIDGGWGVGRFTTTKLADNIATAFVAVKTLHFVHLIKDQVLKRPE